jgi:putative ABC transport system permease protein
LLNIPISKVIEHVIHVKGVSSLPLAGGVTLVIISVVLTLIGGFIPSRLAAKKDPVIALRTE